LLLLPALPITVPGPAHFSPDTLAHVQGAGQHPIGSIGRRDPIGSKRWLDKVLETDKLPVAHHVPCQAPRSCQATAPPTTKNAADSRNALDARVREPGPQCLPWIAIPITDLSSLLLSSDAAPRYLSIMWSCRAPLAPDWLLPRPSPPFPLSAAGYLRAMLLSIVKLYQSRALLGMPFLA
jgi:hypothetical protein